MRYVKLNEHYLKDTYTGMKISQDKALELLNQYENELSKKE